MAAPLSALGRASLLVSALFLAVLLVCLALVLRQAELDIRRELQAADSVARFLALRAADDPALLDASLTANLRHLELDWGDGARGGAVAALAVGHHLVRHDHLLPAGGRRIRPQAQQQGGGQ